MDPIQYESVDPDYWPTQKWRTTTPEEQGMNSNELIEMVQFYEKEHSKNENIAIDSVTIIRNGYVVVDISQPFVSKRHRAYYSFMHQKHYVRFNRC